MVELPGPGKERHFEIVRTRDLGSKWPRIGCGVTQPAFGPYLTTRCKRGGLAAPGHRASVSLHCAAPRVGPQPGLGRVRSPWPWALLRSFLPPHTGDSALPCVK